MSLKELGTVLAYRSARPWLVRLGLLGQLVLLTSLGAAPAHASPADHAVATAGVAMSGRIGAAATAVDTGSAPGMVVRAGDVPVALVGDAPAYGSTDANSDGSSPRTNGALLGGLLGALGGLLIAVTVKLVRRATERREHRATVPSLTHAPAFNPRPPTPAASPPSPAAPASIVEFAPANVPDDGGPATVRTPAAGTAVPPPAWTASPVAPPMPVDAPQEARRLGSPPRSGTQCARCRAVVPAQAAYCGQCGLPRQRPAPVARETAGADKEAAGALRHRPGRWRRWHRIAAVAAAGVVLVAAVTFYRQASPMSPRDTVAAYFEALADRNADRARSMLSQDVANAAPLMLTSGAALRDSGYHPPQHLRIKVVDVRDDVATVEGDYELDGEREQTGLTLIRDGANGKRQPWSINGLPPMPPPSGEYGFEALLIAGTRAPAGYIEFVFHGSYLVSLPDHPIREVTASVRVRAGAREAGVIRTRMREGARQAIETQVWAYLDKCAASAELAPQGCPFSAYSPTPAKDVAWRITGYPTLEITLGPTGDAQVVGRMGTATVTVRGKVLAENTSFALHGDARATGDKILFVPR
ncbi:hypothetical protein ABT214_08005 [Micromonospora purpureochromogenes]|uniref:hypothetical protein n=1 Tax=Micromonospora purpureochromogenes TaxID=47872 RepID=UPI00332C5060